jgi:hypothetical protein
LSTIISIKKFEFGFTGRIIKGFGITGMKGGPNKK